MAIAVMPDEPPDRWGRLVKIAWVVIFVVIFGLFVYSMVDAWLI
jgi:hypothetical protein